MDNTARERIKKQLRSVQARGLNREHKTFKEGAESPLSMGLLELVKVLDESWVQILHLVLRSTRLLLRCSSAGTLSFPGSFKGAEIPWQTTGCLILRLTMIEWISQWQICFPQVSFSFETTLLSGCHLSPQVQAAKGGAPRVPFRRQNLVRFL